MQRMMQGLAWGLGLSLATLAQAGVYKCKSASGAWVFSDTECVAQGQKLRVDHAQTAENQTEKQDQAYANCAKLHLPAEPEPNEPPPRIKKLGLAWVYVKGIGARQQANMNINGEPVSCVLQADGRTVNTGPYELIPDHPQLQR